MYISKKLSIEEHPLFDMVLYHKKINECGYSSFCLVARDNDCFYTSTAYYIMKEINRFTEDEFNELKRRMQSYKATFEKNNGSGFVFDDFFETTVTEMDRHRANNLDDQNEVIKFEVEKRKTPKDMIIRPGDEERLTKPEVYNEILAANLPKENQDIYTHITAFQKLIISAYMRENPERFEPFVGDVFNYTKVNVDVMKKDAGQVEIVAFSEALDIGIDVYQTKYGKWKKHNEDAKFRITLLHTPHHFEPLFDAKVEEEDN